MRILRAEAVVVATLLLTATTCALTGLVAVANFAFPQPAFDQWHFYQTYLTQPFPENVLQLENGHRPIIPALLRVAEITWFHGGQSLQIVFGTTCAALTALVLAWIVWCERTMPLALRAGGVMFAAITVWWLGNARMLMHSNESVHVYLVMLSVVGGTLCVWRAAQSRQLRWAVASTACCMLATFCFGAGISAFPAMAVLALSLRLPWRHVATLGMGLAIALVLYLVVLPGNGGVRGSLDFRPVDSLVTSARWLSSPWVNSWLGLADPPLQAWVSEDAARHWLSRFALRSAQGFKTLGIDWRGWLPPAIGFAGLIALAVATLRRLHRWRTAQRSEVVALGVCLFAAATGILIGIGRLGYFDQYPEQVFADRYLVWPCLFWFGLAILGLHAAAKRSGPRLCTAIAAAALVVPAVFFATHMSYSGWSSYIYQSNQRSAAAARSDVFDADVFPDNADASRSDVLAVLALLQQRQLAMFAEPGSEWLGRTWDKTPSSSPDVEVHIMGTKPLTDARDGSAALRFEGWVTHGPGALRHAGFLGVLDDRGVVCGFAEYSFISPAADALRLSLPRKRGFNGYVRHYDAQREYRLVALSLSDGKATLLATLPPPE